MASVATDTSSYKVSATIKEQRVAEIDMMRTPWTLYLLRINVLVKECEQGGFDMEA